MKLLNIFSKMLFIGFISCGCTSLTKTQLKEINVFGNLTEKFSAYPSKFILTLNSIMEKEALFRANSRLDAGVHFRDIKAVYRRKLANDSLTEKADLTFNIIKKYGQGLALLSSEKHKNKLDTASQSLATDIEGLIDKYNKIAPNDLLPSGMGGAVSDFISFSGGQYIRNQQAKAVKLFIIKADPMITKLTNNIINNIDSRVKDISGSNRDFLFLIGQLRTDLEANYIAFLGKRVTTISMSNNNRMLDSTSFINYRYATLDDDRECLQLMSNLDILERMMSETKLAATNMSSAHHKLLSNIEFKKELKDFAIEIQAYGDAINDLKTSIQKIK